MDSYELAGMLFGASRSEGAESMPDNRDMTVYGVAKQSEDGSVLVHFTDDVTLPEDDGLEHDSYIELPSEVYVEDGDEVAITMSGGVMSAPRVSGVIGGGDRMNVRIAEIEADYVKASRLDADVASIGFLKADSAVITDMQADTAKVHDLTADQLSVATAYIASLNAGSVTAESLIADVGKVHTLTADELSAAAAYIAALDADSVTAQRIAAISGSFDTVQANAAKVANLTAQELEADHATIGSLDANYAQVNLANVNNAWIASGVIRDAAISDGMINSVSANKLTAGTIDASNITVTNLNADNITTGTINGQRIGAGSLSLDKLSEDVYTEAEVNDIIDGLNDRIDGAIQTYTGTVVPTLNNSPAKEWNTAALKDEHVGDVYYVVNSQSQQNGYCYRFTKSGSTYSWQLIKDSDVTAALSRLQTAEGKIGDIEQFDVTVSSFMTDTDDELSSLKTRATSLETSLGDKVDTSTFNTVSQKVDENSASISTLSETVSTKADQSTVTTLSNTVNTVKQTADTNKTSITNLTTTVSDNKTAIENRASTIEQNLSGITTRVGTLESTTTSHGTRLTTAETNITQNTEAIALRATKTEAYQVAQPNLAPFLSVDFSNLYDATTNPNGYWFAISDERFTQLADGWAHFVCDRTSASSTASSYIAPKACPSVVQNGTYTLMLEFRNASFSGTMSGNLYSQQSATSQFWGNDSYDGFTVSNATLAGSGSDFVIYKSIKSVKTWEYSDAKKRLISINQQVTAGMSAEYDIRISLYEGEYTGPYKPYSGTQLYASQAELKVQADRIGMVVSNEDASSSLALTADAMEYIGDHVEIKGTDGTTTVISGGKLVTGSIQANAISASSGTFDTANIPNLSASKITSGTIDAARIDASKLTIGGSGLATQQDVDDISIGGRNLLAWSDRKGATGTSSSGLSWTYDADGWITVTGTINSSSSGILLFWGTSTATNYVYPAGTYTVTVENDGLLAANVLRAQIGYDGTYDYLYDSGSLTLDTENGISRVCLYRYGANGTAVNGRIRFKLERGTKSTDWTPAPEDVDDSIDTAIKSVAQNWFATCSTAAGTKDKVATITPETTDFTLKAGATVNVKFTNTNSYSATASSHVTLNVNGTGAKNIYYGASSAPTGTNTTPFGRANYTNTYVYDGTYWVWVSSSADNNTNDVQRKKYEVNIAAAEAVTNGHIICGTSSGYRNVAANVSFDLNYPLLYAGTAIAKGATTGTRNNNFSAYQNINFSSNGTITSGGAYKMLYLKGTVDSKTFKISASPFLTTAVPTSDDGLAYIPLGLMSSGTNGYFESSADVYAFRNGEFQKLDSVAKYITAITDSGIRVHAKTNHTTNYASIDADGMDVVKGGVSVAEFGETARIGKETDYHTTITTTGMEVSDGTDDVVRIHAEVTQDGDRWGSVDIGKYADGTLTSVGGRAEDQTEDDYVYRRRVAELRSLASTESDGAWVSAWSEHATTYDEDLTGVELHGEHLDLTGGDGYVYASVDMETAGKVISTQSGMVAQSIDASPNSVTTHTVTFPTPYDEAPIVVACFYSTSVAAAFGGLSIAVSAITTTSFTVKIFNNTGTGRTPGIFWIATPQTSQT